MQYRGSFQNPIQRQNQIVCFSPPILRLPKGVCGGDSSLWDGGLTNTGSGEVTIRLQMPEYAIGRGEHRVKYFRQILNLPPVEEEAARLGGTWEGNGEWWLPGLSGFPTRELSPRHGPPLTAFSSSSFVSVPPWFPPPTGSSSLPSHLCSCPPPTGNCSALLSAPFENIREDKIQLKVWTVSI